MSSDWFSPSYWQQNDAVTGQSQGRNITYFVKHQDKQLVLRHYYRGGLIGKIAKDGYLYAGLKQSRVYKEFALLEKMLELGLPVPKPIAARLVKKLHLYTADIIMEQIPLAQDLFQILKVRALTKDEWINLGNTIAKFHHNGIYHADLNIHNLMMDNTGKIWLIDFDRGQIKPNKTKWQKSNLERLKRSLEKEKSKYPEFNWQANQWLHLLKGYQSQD